MAGSANLCIVLFISGSFSTIKQQWPILLKLCDNTMWFGSNCIWIDCRDSLIYSPFLLKLFFWMMARALGDSLDGLKGAPISDIQDAKQDLCVPSDFVLKCTEEKGNVWEKRGLSLCHSASFTLPFFVGLKKNQSQKTLTLPCHLRLMRSFGLTTNENPFIPLLIRSNPLCCERLRRQLLRGREVLCAENASPKVKSMLIWLRTPTVETFRGNAVH